MGYKIDYAQLSRHLIAAMNSNDAQKLAVAAIKKLVNREQRESIGKHGEKFGEEVAQSRPTITTGSAGRPNFFACPQTPTVQSSRSIRRASTLIYYDSGASSTHDPPPSFMQHPLFP